MSLINQPNRKQVSSDQSGIALIELAIIMPLFVAISFVGLELSRALSYAEASTSLSREAASRAFRVCASHWSSSSVDTSAISQATACLKTQEEALEKFANRLFPNTEIILTLFRYGTPGTTEDCSTPNLSAGFTRVARAGNGNYLSRYPLIGSNNQADPSLEQGLSVQGLDSNTGCLLRAIVVAEVYVPYKTVSGTAASLFSWNPEEFYSSAVM